MIPKEILFLLGFLIFHVFLLLGLAIEIHCCFGIANAFETNSEIERMSAL